MPANAMRILSRTHQRKRRPERTPCEIQPPGLLSRCNFKTPQDLQLFSKLLIAIFKPVVNLVIFLRNWRRFVVGAVRSRSGELAAGYELKRRDALNKCH